jgi:hypothetical protein
VKEVAHLWYFTSDSVGKLLLTLHRGPLLRWCPLPYASQIGVPTSLFTIKHEKYCIHLGQRF